MKKTLASVVLLALAAVALSGCSSHETLSGRTRGTDDMGSIALNNGYALHGYRLMNGINHDHYVYFLEKDGKPVAGTTANSDVSQGKGSVNETISTEIGPSASSTDTCATETECEAKIAALSHGPRLRQLQLEYQQLQSETASR